MKECYKIFVTTPQSHTQIIIDSMSKSGAGKVGNYSKCAFITKGTGTFLPNENANPTVGEVGKLNQEPEDKIEMVCPIESLDEVIKSIKDIHPYETPTIDVIKILFFN